MRCRIDNSGEAVLVTPAKAGKPLAMIISHETLERHLALRDLVYVSW